MVQRSTWITAWEITRRLGHMIFEYDIWIEVMACLPGRAHSDRGDHADWSGASPNQDCWRGYLGELGYRQARGHTPPTRVCHSMQDHMRRPWEKLPGRQPARISDQCLVHWHAMLRSCVAFWCMLFSPEDVLPQAPLHSSAAALHEVT